MPIDIYLFPAIRLYQEFCHFWSFVVQFLHFMAENGTISSKFSVHRILKVKILCRLDGYDFMKPHVGYPMVCTKMWHAPFFSQRTLGLAPSLAAP